MFKSTMTLMGPLMLLVGCGAYADYSVPSDSTWSDTTEPPEDTVGPGECDAGAPVVLYVSPDDSNSMSSPVQVRAAALNGWAVRGDVAYRTWEYFNYYRWDYVPADPGELALDVQMDVRGDEPGDFTLQVGLTSEHISNAQRAPMNLTLVMDASCSMSGDPILFSRQVMKDISSQLKDGDIVSVVTWDTSNAVLLDGLAVQGPDDPNLDNVITSFDAGGGTDLSGGLKEGYRLATENHSADRINRLVLVSDGGANAGTTDEEIIGEHAGNQDGSGIYLIGVGVGSASSYNDALMDRVTDVGRGASVFIDSVGESQRMFRDRFVETLSVAARDVQIRYDLPPGFEIERFSGEEFATTPEEIEPQHVAPSDSVVLHQHLHGCAELEANASIDVTVTYLDGVTLEPKEVFGSWPIEELLGQASSQLRKGEAVFAYAEAMDPAKLFDKDDAMPYLVSAEAANPGDPDLAEIRSVLEAL